MFWTVSPRILDLISSEKRSKNIGGETAQSIPDIAYSFLILFGNMWLLLHQLMESGASSFSNNSDILGLNEKNPIIRKELTVCQLK